MGTIDSKSSRLGPEDLIIVPVEGAFQVRFAVPGNPPIPIIGWPRFAFATPFSEDLAAVCDGDGRLHEGDDSGDKWYHIGKDGKPAYPERYCLVQPFSEGMAVVTRKCGRQIMCFYIRPDGSRAFDKDFDEAGSFCGGVARVRVGNYWWNIDRKGRRCSKKSFCDRFGASD